MVFRGIGWKKLNGIMLEWYFVFKVLNFEIIRYWWIGVGWCYDKDSIFYFSCEEVVLVLFLFGFKW